MSAQLDDRFVLLRPFEEMELALVREALRTPSFVDAREEALVRTALGLARLGPVHHAGRDVEVGTALTPFREDVRRRLTPVLLGRTPPTRRALLPHLGPLRDATLRTRSALLARHADALPPEALDREVREKKLVLVLGGGGGTAFVYIGVMALLDALGVRPALLVGASMGAILALFRSRLTRFDQAGLVNIVRTLSWPRLFRAFSMESRYALPGALRLFLRAGIGRYFEGGADTAGMRLKDLPVPTLVTVGAVRRGALPRPLEAYGRLGAPGRAAEGDGLWRTHRFGAALAALRELTSRPDVLAQVTLGADDATAEFDAVDAAGFSSSLPGVVHYDVLREDARMHGLLGDLLASRGLFRLVDGGLVDNVPAREAWRAVQRGRVGTRNVFILALDGFAPRLTTPLWLPLQRVAAANVERNLPYAHLLHRFKRTLSPLDVVPSVELLLKAMELGRRQLDGALPLLTRMVAPLPPIPVVAGFDSPGTV
ncbi:MAG: patatin-like phospholipase family protein [Myxococcaceae bacterium]|nr:patatin-like phospholipase family protein [Myxococcaceae bacterium]MCI0673078.1 patatin-like phospholipase family protein [Myxococcaceae bacterium]